MIEAPPVDQLSAIKEEYRQHLAEEAANLRSLAARAQEPIARGELRRFLHRLAGTAGTYGYDGIADLARSIQRSIDRDDPLTAFSGELSNLVTQLGTAARG